MTVPNNLRIREIGFESLKVNGNDEVRIGPDLKRNARLNALDPIEQLIRSVIPEHVTMDAAATQPPQFTKFSYHDCLGGLQLATGSAEVNARIAALTQDDTPVEQFDYMRFDKYALAIPDELPKQLDGVILMPGPNLFTTIDQNRFFEVIDETDWPIKPHPVSNDVSIKELADAFGYHRVYQPKVSGYALYKAAERIVTTQSSEFILLAALEGKEVLDITRRQHSWMTTYHPQYRLTTGNAQLDKVIINRALMHPSSGYLHPSMSVDEQTARIKAFYQRALDIRETFKMLTTQKLTPMVGEFKNWIAPTRPIDPSK